MLKKLFQNTTNKNNIHIYLDNVEKIVEQTKNTLKKLQIDAETKGEKDMAKAYQNAWFELNFMTSKIMCEQLRSEIK